MATGTNIQTTSSSDISTTMQTYYDKRLLQNMKPKLVHQAHGQKRQIPKGTGKTVQFRKWTPFPAITDALNEGVTPTSQTLIQTEVTATVTQHGGYVEGSDLLNLTAIDPVLDETTELMGDQGGLSIDTIVRDVMAATTNVQYANSKTSRDQLERTDKLDTTEIRKAVRTLKNNKAKPFMRNGRPFYYAIVDPDSTYDLQDDTKWLAVSEYQKGENIENGEIGKLFGCVFIETTNAKKYENDGDLSEGSANLTAASLSTLTVTLDEVLTSDDATALAGRTVIVKDISADPDVWEVVEIDSAAAGTAGTATITLTEAPSFTIAAGDIFYPDGAGADGDDISATLVFGKEAYGVIDVANENSGNVRNIIKPKGSAGATDPLDQRWTSGWKVEAFVSKILQPAWIVKIEHGYSR